MSFGYFTIAQGEAYLRCAYALALSLKASQPFGMGKLSIGVAEGDFVPGKYRAAFDEVVTIPWEDEAKDSAWKLQNEWKSIHMSPYDETVKLDADMLFTTDVSWWLPYMQQHDLIFATQVYTHRGQLIDSDFCRKTFTANMLPNVYSAFFYFKKTRPAYELFETSEVIFKNWQTYWREQLEPKTRPSEFSTDVAFAIAAKQLETKSPCIGFPTFVHMKGELQGWEKVTMEQSQRWAEWLPYNLTQSKELYIGRFKQALPFHYQVKSFVTDNMLATLESK